MLSLAWKDWKRKASNFPPEVAFQLYSFHWVSQKDPKTIENDLLLEFQCLALTMPRTHG